MFNYLDVLDSDGLIARRRPGYERRAAQLAMAAEVDAAIRSRQCLAIEAGTGVGKSFGYLVPAILYAIEDQVRHYDPNDYFELPDVEPLNDATEPAPSQVPRRVSSTPVDLFNGSLTGEQMRRVVVSTHTISLQEQLFEKDIPFLNSILPFEFTAVLAKGRSNYVCRRRFANAMKSQAQGTLLKPDAQSEFIRLQTWILTSSDGSKSDLNPPTSPEIWDEINCEQGNCLGKKCKHYRECFFTRARHRLRNANLIIVNHALLFSDVALQDGSILPNYDVLVIDEAHTIEEVAGDHFGIELTESAIDYLLTRLYNVETHKGLLANELDRVNGQPFEGLFQEAADTVDDCGRRNEVFFDSIREWLEARANSNGRVLEPKIVPNGLGEGLKKLKRVLERASDVIEEEERRQEYIAATQRVASYLSAIDDWLEQRAEGYVYWIESSRTRVGRVRTTLNAAPIDVAPILRQNLFNRTPSVIVASATLTTGDASAQLANANANDAEVKVLAVGSETESEETRNAFAFFRGRVGLHGAPARSLGSPFNYREQMTLVMTKGLALTPSSWNARRLSKEQLDELNFQRLQNAILDYIDETDGGAFVLFTNSEQMKRVTDGLTARLAERNYPFFSQSEGLSRQMMVERFKETSRSVLFGVDSFWQGVDVPGAALRNVVIVSLPFQSPGQPLTEARMKAIEERGGNAFRDYSLPNAILKFKQGVGRLIRTRSDFGQVVVLDERLHMKPYGRQFLTALPDCKLRLDVFK